MSIKSCKGFCTLTRRTKESLCNLSQSFLSSSLESHVDPLLSPVSEDQTQGSADRADILEGACVSSKYKIIYIFPLKR